LLNKHKTLSELNIILIQGICRYLQIKTRFTTASELGVTGKKVGKLVDLCKRLGADYYLANNASSSYLDTEMLETNGIKCEYQNYEHPTYEQWYNKYLLPFISHLSIIDLLFNYGHNSLEIIRKGNQQL